MKQRMLASGRRRVVVADGSKVGAVSVANVCPIDDVDLLLTGASAPIEIVDQLTALELNLEIVAEQAAAWPASPPPPSA